MKVAVVGTGYVGLVTGTCLAQVGYSITCVDKDQSKISVLRMGGIPIYEDGLGPLVAQNRTEGRLQFTDDLSSALDGAEVVFIAVGTPQGEDGSADLSYVLAAATEIGQAMTGPLVVVQKSTCPVGTARQVEECVRASLEKRGAQIPFGVVSNPEFLREGNAVKDFMEPDRVVIGADDEDSGRKVASLYERIVPVERILVMDRASAELTKYAANAFLATKISFINDIANLCELVGADVENVRRGIGSDNRIGPAFLAAGIGYGGSCFPKDVKALMRTGRTHGHSLEIIEAVEAINQVQRRRQLSKIVRHFGGTLAGRRIAVLGVAFKPGTDDMREAPSVAVINDLVELGAEVVVYDPVAMENARRVLGKEVLYADNALSCVEAADAVVLITEWPEFLELDLVQVGSRVKHRVLFDYRNSFELQRVAEAGFTYFGVGRVAKATTPAVAGS